MGNLSKIGDAIVAVGGLLAFAAVVCWAPGWRFFWAVLPFLVVCVAVMRIANHEVTRSGVQKPRDEDSG